MMRLSDLFRTKPLDVALKPGTYKFDGAGDLSHHRFHLRVDNEGSGVLLVDASKLIFLNGTGLDYVRCALEGKDDVETSIDGGVLSIRGERKPPAGHGP